MARLALLALFALLANAVCLPKCIAQPQVPLKKAPPCHQQKAPKADQDCAHPQVAALEKASSIAILTAEPAIELPAAPAPCLFVSIDPQSVGHHSPPRASITILRV